MIGNYEFYFKKCACVFNTIYRIEIETFLTGKTKWDSVGFCPTLDKKIGVVLVEFSGGILWNKTKKKLTNDMKKIEKGVIDFLEYTNLNVGHFVRYHGNFFSCPSF